MRCATLALWVALSGCTCNPTRAQLNRHPARQLASWGGVPDTPLEERVLYPAPERVLDYIRKDNVLQGYNETPRQVDLDEAMLRDLRDAVREMPAAVKALVAPKLLAIVPIAELGGSAYTETVTDGSEIEAGAWILIDASVLDRTANAWATWKESNPFRADDDYEIEAIIEEPENDTRKNAMQYILLHELGHVAPLRRGLVPHWARSMKHVKEGDYPYFRLNWRVENGRVVSTVDEMFSERREVFFYRPDRKLPASAALPIYEQLQGTGFPTLYGLTGYLDDFAEGFVTYVHTELQGRPYEVKLYVEGALRMTYTACWNEPRCAEKREVFDELFSSP